LLGRGHVARCVHLTESPQTSYLDHIAENRTIIFLSVLQLIGPSIARSRRPWTRTARCRPSMDITNPRGRPSSRQPARSRGAREGRLRAGEARRAMGQQARPPARPRAADILRLELLAHAARLLLEGEGLLLYYILSLRLVQLVMNDAPSCAWACRTRASW
jgi:hypothetical protein